MALLEQVTKLVLMSQPRRELGEMDSPAVTGRNPSSAVTQSISQSPAVAVGVAIATGVVLGCLLKR